MNPTLFHPVMAKAVAAERVRDMQAQARAARQAREVRQARRAAHRAAR